MMGQIKNSLTGLAYRKIWGGDRFHNLVKELEKLGCFAAAQGG
jgi:hypothetical protein